MWYIKLFIEREKNTGQSAPECPFNTSSQARLRNANSTYPTCVRRPHYGPSEYCYAVWHGKTRMVWLLDGEKILMICLFVLTQFMNVMDTHTESDRQMDTAWQHRPRLHSIARQPAVTIQLNKNVRKMHICSTRGAVKTMCNNHAPFQGNISAAVTTYKINAGAECRWGMKISWFSMNIWSITAGPSLVINIWKV